MATLQQIYVNLLVGSALGSASLGLFGLALRYGYNSQLAPRSWSRPRAILKNALKAPYAFSWMCWSMKLSYPDLMLGIPGTGTREDGWAGPALKVNLDGIIMIKYHVLLLKVAFLATILCSVIILPVNITAKCDVELLGEDTCAPIDKNLTDFEVTTIAHLPPLRYNGTAAGDSAQLLDFWYAHLSPRYYAIAFVALVIYRYICHLVWKEWIENLALRRIYYLEHDHYAERREELNEIAELDVPEDPSQKSRPAWLPHPELRETVPNVSLYSCLYQLPNQISTVNLPDSATDLERQLAAAVEFFDQCVPNQPGFSSSVVAVTILPEPAHVAQAWRKWYTCGKRLRKLRYIRQRIQLRLERQQAEEDEEWVVEDHVEAPKEIRSVSSVPNNNEGEESETLDPQVDIPVADIQASEGDATATVDIETGKQTEDEDRPLLEDEKAPTVNITSNDAPNDAGSFFDSVIGQVFRGSTPVHVPEDENIEKAAIEQEREELLRSPAEITNIQDFEPDRSHEAMLEMNVASPSHQSNAETSGAFKYSRFDVNEVAKSIGLLEATMTKDLIADIGIEQLSVYAREYAQICFPYGLGERRIQSSTLEQLQNLEQEAIANLEEANAELIDAREAVNRLTSGITAENIDEDVYDPAVSKKSDGPNVMTAEDAKNEGDVRRSVRQRAMSASRKKWQRAQTLVGSIQQDHKLKFNESTFCGGCMKHCSKEASEVIKEATLASIPRVGGEQSSHRKLENMKRVVNILKHPTYAVVTFTSRQSAIAARQCLADGGGLDRWIEIEELPVAPLADAPPCDLLFCRGCCRPVTLTISEREKKARRFVGVTLFLSFCFFYTIPLALTSQLLNPEKLAEVFPDWEALQNDNSFFFQVLSGISSGLLYTLFFSFCPQLFKAIANFEGNVSSKRSAEDKALKYFWFFMMLTAFTGTALAQMLSEVFLNSQSFGAELKDVLVAVADSIPTQQAPVWMNWLIVKFTYTFPFMYMFQANTFGFSIIQWPCCARLMAGGGPGGPPPYRIFVDSGTALMCIVAIAPVCPLIAPLVLAYFVMMLLMLRWLLTFVYRPWYDAGGNKWPALHEIILSATIFGQVLLASILLLRNSNIPGLVIALSVLPTFLFSQNCKEKFLRAYNDSSLLQTSRLDGWDSKIDRSTKDREEFRQWLVDAHKASYVPICLAGSESPLTVEPAVVAATRQMKGDGSKMQKLVHQTSQRGARFARPLA